MIFNLTYIKPAGELEPRWTQPRPTLYPASMPKQSPSQNWVGSWAWAIHTVDMKMMKYTPLSWNG